MSESRIAACVVRAAVLLALLAAGGCGGDDEPTRTGAASSAQREGLTSTSALISREDISAAGRDSPGAALLSWWQNLQFRDVDGARRLYARGVEPSLAPAMRELRAYIVQNRLTVVQTDIDGNRARVLVLFRTVARGQPQAVRETPATFRLVREDGWKLADNLFLASIGRALDEAARRPRSG
ncbi:MAG TPA: hypothetical protein VF549_13980 [Solirubrobacteraceae bacterium]